MAYGTANVDVIQSSTAGTPPQFNDGNGTQTGTLCRAWVNYKGTATVGIRASFNVSSVTVNGTGDYTVNFANALNDANYSVVGACSPNATGSSGRIFSAPKSAVPTTSAIRVSTAYAVNIPEDQEYVFVSVFR